MAASITSITKSATRGWIYTWTGTSPYHVYRSGKDVYGRPVTFTSATFINDDNEEPPIIEVIDSTQTSANVQTFLYPTYAILQWRGAAWAQYYRVELKSTDGNGTVFYTEKQKIAHRTIGYYTFATGDLDDETDYDWRVVAIDSQGNENPVHYQFFFVRSPAAPSISLSYSAATGNLTVAART